MTDAPQRRAGPCWTGFWMGVGAATFALLAAMFGPHAVNMGAIQSKLQARVETALAASPDFRDVRVRMDGQTAVLSGAVASESARAAAHAAALKAVGAGGPFFGGVVRVNDQVIIGERVSPFSWSAERGNDTLVLSGHVPGADARNALMQIARTRFPGLRIEDRMQDALGAPPGDWTAIAVDALAQLAKLERAKARLVDDRLAVIGEGEQASVADVRAHFGKPLAAPFTVSVIDLTVEGQSLGIREIEGVNLSEASAQSCQTAFQLLMRGNVIEFTSGSAAIDPSSQRLLDDLAKVARRCDQYSIAVAGHTDNVGDPRMNVALSQARADAVRAYLVDKGVAADRLTTQGFGASKPRGPNTTAAGRASNRRIEFTVS